MSYQVGSACYSTPLQAAQVQASTEVGSIVQHGSAAYVVGLSAIADDSITYVLSPLDGTAAITKQIPFQAQPCHLLEAVDGLTIGWLVAGVWLSTAAILFLRRALRGESGGDDGNS